MKRVKPNHTVISGVTSVTNHVPKPKPTPVQVPRKRTFSNNGYRGCKSCGQS